MQYHIGQIKLLKPTFITLALLNTYSVYADKAVTTQTIPETYYNTRVTGQFLTGSNQQLGGFGDAMLPLVQSQQRILFTDGTVLLGRDDRSTFSAGLGYRGIEQTRYGSGILGAYTFGEYYQTDLKNSFWQLNPGLEWLTERYEARLQAYIPLSTHSKVYSDTLASAIPQSVLMDSGHSNTLARTTGHSIIDTPVQLVEELGSGIELEAGRFFAYGKGLWLRAGGYYFSYPDTNAIIGGQANVEMAVNDYAAVILQNNYDAQNKNRFAIGLRVNFGGSTAPRQTLESRMTSPIIRHTARQSYGEAQPTRQNFRASGSSFTVMNNVWFFSPNGTAPLGAGTSFAQCTKESPCLTIDTPTATQIDLLTPNAQLYFEPGTYVIPQNATRVAYLRNGQTMLGRNKGWLSPAVGADRPVIQGGLFWGDASIGDFARGTLHNMMVVNNNQLVPATRSGFDRDAVIAVGAAGNMEAHNSSLESTATTAVALDSLTSFALLGQNIITSNTDAQSRAQGSMRVISTGFYSFDNATVIGGTQTATAISDSNNDRATARGIFAQNNATITNASTSATAEGAGTFASNAYGVLVNGDTNIDRLNSRLILTGGMHTARVQSSTNATAAGIVSPNGAIISAANTQAFAESTGTGNASAAGIGSGVGNAVVEVTGGTHTAQALSIGNATASGIIGGSSNIIKDVRVSATATSSGAGSVLARAVSGFDALTITGSTLAAEARSAGTVTAAGVQLAPSGTSAVVATVSGTSINAAALSNGATGNATANGIQVQSSATATSTVEVNNSTVITSAVKNGAAGTATANGIQAGLIVANATNTNTSATNTGAGMADAKGLVASTFPFLNPGQATVTGGAHTVSANSGSGAARVRAVEASNEVTIQGTALTATGTRASGGIASVIGVLSPSGTVDNTTIIVQANPGAGSKCSGGVTSSDGSCT